MKTKFGVCTTPLYDAIFPLIKKEIAVENDKPWYNSECKNQKRALRKSERVYRNCNPNTAREKKEDAYESYNLKIKQLLLNNMLR